MFRSHLAGRESVPGVHFPAKWFLLVASLVLLDSTLFVMDEGGQEGGGMIGNESEM